MAARSSSGTSSRSCGSFRRVPAHALRPRSVGSARRRAPVSVHQIGVSDLIEGARLRGRLPPRLRLLGVVPLSVELGVHRTAAVEAAIPALVDAVAAEVKALGYRLSQRSPDELDRHPGWDVHRVLGL